MSKGRPTKEGIELAEAEVRLARIHKLISTLQDELNWLEGCQHLFKTRRKCNVLNQLMELSNDMSYTANYLLMRLIHNPSTRTGP